MPLISIQSYSDPEQLEAAYRAAEVELTPTRSGPFEARVVRLELDRLWLQRVYEATPRIKRAAQSPARAFIRFQTQPGPDAASGGIALRSNELMYHSKADSYFEPSWGPLHWAAISLPVDDMAVAAIAIAGGDWSPPCEAQCIIPAGEAMTRLQRLHAEASTLVETVPPILDRSEVVHSLEQSLIEAVVHCLSDSDICESTWARRCHGTVMRRFHGLLEEHPERAVYLPEICAAIRVPERTLRVCCHEQMGVSPKHYLMLRRMHLAHRVLQASIPTKTTVTEVATRFGFWHLSRFAGTYRPLFGESPSTTLGRLLQ